jgi:hypothetical protein
MSFRRVLAAGTLIIAFGLALGCQGRGQSTPTIPSPTIAASPIPLPNTLTPHPLPTGPLWAYPDSTRTGIAAVDRFLALYSGGRLDEMVEEAVFSIPAPCQESGFPPCEPSKPQGTIVLGFPLSSCSPNAIYSRMILTERFPRPGVARLFGIYQPVPSGDSDPYNSSFVIVLKEEPGNSGYSLHIDDSGRLRAIISCNMGQWPPAAPNGITILPPLVQ